jgi:hypothetical protein
MTVRMTVYMPTMPMNIEYKQSVTDLINVFARYIDRILQSSAAFR